MGDWNLNQCDDIQGDVQKDIRTGLNPNAEGSRLHNAVLVVASVCLVSTSTHPIDKVLDNSSPNHGHSSSHKAPENLSNGSPTVSEVSLSLGK